MCLIVSNQKSWPTSQLLFIQTISHCEKRESLCPSSPFRSRKSTHFMMAGMWPVSSSFFFLFSPSCPWQRWLCSMSCWTVGAAPKGKHTTSYRRKGREAAASLWVACARSQNPTLRWYSGNKDEVKNNRNLDIVAHLDRTTLLTKMFAKMNSQKPPKTLKVIQLFTIRGESWWLNDINVSSHIYRRPRKPYFTSEILPEEKKITWVFITWLKNTNFHYLKYPYYALWIIPYNFIRSPFQITY